MNAWRGCVFYMKLKIKNFAKLNQADILVDGITVIAGENNTGKSTIGKILFSLFNAINNIDQKIFEQREEEIEDSCRMVLRDYFMQNSSVRSAVIRNASSVARQIASKIMEKINSDDFTEYMVRDILVESLDTLPQTKNEDQFSYNELLDLLVNKIMTLLNISDEEITLEVLSRYFQKVFNNQINSLIQKNKDAELNLDIKGNNIDLRFQNDECQDFNSDILIMYKAIYIENPFVIDNLTKISNLNVMDEFLKKLLKDNISQNIMEGIIGSVLVKEKLEDINKALQNVVDGNIIFKQDNFYLEKEGFNEPISFNNLSTGLKAFVLLKMLLEKGALKEKDVLIFDKPEIHLHPQWQIVYAELIVLLQKHFDLSIIVATHSPYFLDAIDLYSVKYGINPKVNYYLLSIQNNYVNMELVTGQIDKIYKKMATPIQALDTLRYELNNN